MKPARNHRLIQSPRRIARFRPWLLCLEDRLLLSAYTVDSLGDAGTGSGTSGDFRYCLNHVAAGDSVSFDVTGTIDLTRPLPTLSVNLSIEGPGADNLTVERNSTGDFRIFMVALGATVQISGLTIANGSENQGGAILNNGTLTVTDDVFQANMAIVSGGTPGNGGAIYNGGTLTVVDSVFNNDTVVSTQFNGGLGGAIVNPSTKVANIRGSTFASNTALGSPASGGALYNAGTMTLDASTLSGNTSAGDSGGINNTGTLMVNNSLFSGNAANGSSGGAIDNTGTLMVTGSQFLGNTTRQSGGAIENPSQQMVTITASIFSGNTAVGSGGAIDNAGRFGSGSMTVSGSTLSNNSAISGGGISSAVTLTITNSTVTGNSVTGTQFSNSSGGGIADSGTLTITNSTVAGNRALGGSSTLGLGGGINYGNSNSLVNLNSCTIANNIASSGGGLYIVSGPTSPVRPRNILLAGNMATMGPDLFGRINSQGHNLIQDPSQGIGFDATDLLTVDPLLDPRGLQSNGGPTQTIALQAGSPAIDAGDNTGADQWDQRGPGFPRIVNGIIDIGAFEVQNSQAAALQVTAPVKVFAGTPFSITVTAVDTQGNVVPGYTGTVTFSTTDPDSGVVLPADYTFTLADGGVHTFTDTGLGETILAWIPTGR
jgi:hypothetical protein